MSRARRSVPLAWKLMLPYLLLVVVVGAAGAVVVVHSLATRAQAAVDEQASRGLLDARSTLRDRELYLLESADYAANIQGVAAAVARGDDVTAQRLLLSVLALKSDVTLLVATDRRGVGVSELDRADGQTSTGTGTTWAGNPLVREVLRSTRPRPAAGVLVLPTGPVLALAAPVCGGTAVCRPVGVALAGVPLDAVLKAAAPAAASLAWFDATGHAVAASGTVPPAPPRHSGDGLVRVRSGGGAHAETVYGPLQMQGSRVADLGLTVPTKGAFASVRNAATRLTVILVLAMLGVMAIGGLLARSLLRQVRMLVDTNRRLGGGDLAARVEVRSRDEIGELSVGFNQMAEQLQAAVTTLESRAEQSAEEVQRLLQQRTEFFAGLSHEFRTPLAVIRAQAALLLERGGRRRADEQMSLEVVQQAASQALDLVNDVLEMSRNDAMRVELDVAPTSAAEVVQQLQPTMQGLASGADVALSVHVEEGLPLLWSDGRRIGQVLLNLVDNAVKYTPAGGTVDVRAEHADEGVVLSVSDSGIGIPPDQVDDLFRPFARIRGSATQRGQASTGLGLALTRQLVEALAGSIDVGPRPGGGTVFVVRLPVGPPARAVDELQLPVQPTRV